MVCFAGAFDPFIGSLQFHAAHKAATVCVTVRSDFRNYNNNSPRGQAGQGPNRPPDRASCADRNAKSYEAMRKISRRVRRKSQLPWTFGIFTTSEHDDTVPSLSHPSNPPCPNCQSSLTALVNLSYRPPAYFCGACTHEWTVERRQHQVEVDEERRCTTGTPPPAVVQT